MRNPPNADVWAWCDVAAATASRILAGLVPKGNLTKCREGRIRRIVYSFSTTQINQKQKRNAHPRSFIIWKIHFQHLEIG